MLTNAGLQWIWRMCAGELRGQDGGLTDELKSARIVVGDGDRPFQGTDTRLAGDQTAQAPLDPGYPMVLGMVDDGLGPDGEPVRCRIAFSATFGEDAAIFDWQERGIITAQGVLLDRVVRDNGRKVLGAVWTVEATIDLGR